MLATAYGRVTRPGEAVDNGWLGLLSMIGRSEHVGLMPKAIMAHPLAGQFLQVIPVSDGGLQLSIGAITKPDTLLKPAVRHFLAHLHRAAHQVSRNGLDPGEGPGPRMS